MNKKEIIIITLIGLLVFLITPNIVEARLVPCGPDIDIPCQICHLFVIIQRLANFILFTIAPPLASLFLILAGFKYYQAAVENPEQAQKVKGIIISVFVGLIIIYGSLGFLTIFTNHIADIPIYSHIQELILACPVPTGFWQ